MGLIVETHPLSALTPVKLTYNFNKEEEINCTLNAFENGLRYYSHDAFENFKDVVISNKNCLVLTDPKPLKDVFKNDVQRYNVGYIAGCLYLKTPDNKYFTNISNQIYIGGSGTKLFINIFPLTGSTVELKVNKDTRIVIDKEYPFQARLSREVLPSNEIHRQQFEVDYKDGVICFKTKTEDGDRYLSYGSDFIVRATGLALNETAVNPYLLIPEFTSNETIDYDFDAKTSEIKYFNNLHADENKKTVAIREATESNTSLLISCATSDIAKTVDLSSSVKANIALTKTNFSSSGTYSTKT